MGDARSRLGLRLVVAATALLAANPAAAQTFTISVNTAPNLGNIVPATSGPTTFKFTPAGAVTTLSGSAVRAGGGSVRGAVQISCSGQGNACNSAVSKVRIGAIGTPTGKAGALSNFTVSIASGGTIGNVTGTNPVEFTVTQQNKNATPIINFGAEVVINGADGGGTVGPATSGFYAYIAPSPTTPTTGVSGNLTAVASRPISLTGSPVLVFGALTKPTNGAGSVSLSAVNSNRTVAGSGVVGLSTPTPARATYSVTGEGGQSISVSVPGSFTMNGPNGATISVTLISNGLPTSLSNAAGSEGTASFSVGGAFNLSSSMATGDYSGIYTVTAQYN